MIRGGVRCGVWKGGRPLCTPSCGYSVHVWLVKMREGEGGRFQLSMESY